MLFEFRSSYERIGFIFATTVMAVFSSAPFHKMRMIIGSLSNHDDDGNKSVTNLHI